MLTLHPMTFFIGSGGSLGAADSRFTHLSFWSFLFCTKTAVQSPLGSYHGKLVRTASSTKNLLCRRAQFSRWETTLKNLSVQKRKPRGCKNLIFIGDFTYYFYEVLWRNSEAGICGDLRLSVVRWRELLVWVSQNLFELRKICPIKPCLKRLCFVHRHFLILSTVRPAGNHRPTSKHTGK